MIKRRLSSTGRQIVNLIRHSREEQGMSLRAFAAVLGVSHQTVQFWEHGTYPPLTDVLFRIKRTAADEWARQLAMDCLSLRFPDQIVNGNNGSTEPAN